LRVQATNSPAWIEVTTDGTGVVGHAGAALLRELADRLELTSMLGWRVPAGDRRQPHPDAAVVRDLAVMLADGGDCLSDLAALREQPELFGPVASTRPPGGCWSAWPRTRTGWPGCAWPGRTPGGGRERPAATRRWSCWSSTPTRPWWWPTARPRRCGRHLQAHLRVRPAAGVSGSRPGTRGAAGRHPAAGQRRPGRCR
jgi:hypothetical protein